MTALSLELMDFTRDWVSSFVMLCQAFTAADFSCCLFVGLSAFSFVFSKWNACLIRLRSGDWLCHCRIFHFLPSKTPGLLYLYVLGHRPFVLWSATQSTLLHLIESVQRVYTLQNSSGCFCPLSSLNTSGPVPLEAMHAQAITLLHHVSHSQMMLYALDHELFQAEHVSGVERERSGERSGHISFRAESTFWRFRSARSIRSGRLAQPKMPFGNLLVRESVE